VKIEAGSAPRANHVRVCDKPVGVWVARHPARLPAAQPSSKTLAANLTVPIVDHNLGRQVALALARPAGLGQDPTDLIRRERPGNHAEAAVVAKMDASRKAGRSTSHCSRSLKTRPTASACRMPK
jgi:hypothetical protein